MHTLAAHFLFFVVVGSLTIVVTGGVEMGLEEVKFQKLTTAAIPMARDVLDLISQRYEYETILGRSFMLMQSNLGKEDYDHLKYSLAMKMLAEEEKNSSYLMVRANIIYIYIHVYTMSSEDGISFRFIC